MGVLPDPFAMTHRLFEPPNPPSHFITRHGEEVHRYWKDRLESWVALCGVTTEADPKWRHHGPTSCLKCLRSEGR